MHRSGTSMLARILREIGVFIGRNRTRNEECRWTNSLNYWIFSQASATWDRPEGVRDLLQDSQACELIADYLQGVVSGPASIRYLGVKRWIRHRSMLRISEPWGWKDPRNTYALPLWLRVFPRARVLHITRHGMDVAQSLRRRSRIAAEQAADRYRRRRGIYVGHPFAPKRSGIARQPRVNSLEGGLALWREYMEQGAAHARKLGDQLLQLRYEDLLRDPMAHLKQVTEFCGLQVDEHQLRRWSYDLRPDRAFAYRNDPELREMAEQNRQLLAQYGYAD